MFNWAISSATKTCFTLRLTILYGSFGILFMGLWWV